MIKQKYIGWVPVPCHIPHVVEATSHADARRVIGEALEAGEGAEEAPQMTSHIQYDGWDGEPEDWDVVAYDTYFGLPSVAAPGPEPTPSTPKEAAASGQEGTP